MIGRTPLKGPFQVTVTDHGEPGPGKDTFTIDVAGPVGDSESGTLSGGNIQVHNMVCF